MSPDPKSSLLQKSRQSCKLPVCKVRAIGLIYPHNVFLIFLHISRTQEPICCVTRGLRGGVESTLFACVWSRLASIKTHFFSRSLLQATVKRADDALDFCTLSPYISIPTAFLTHQYRPVILLLVLDGESHFLLVVFHDV